MSQGQHSYVIIWIFLQ